MRRSGFAAIILVILLYTACAAPTVFAAESSVSEELPTQTASASAAPTIPGGTVDAALPSEDPDDTESPEPTDSSNPTEEPTAAATASEPVPTDSADPTEEPSSIPDDDPSVATSPAPEPTEAPPVQSPADAPSLEMSAGQTIYLNQETPSIKIRWKNGIPDSVAGYVWSFATGSSSKQVFYVTYDPSSTALAAGALNGHVTSPGTYKIWCQPVNADQEPVTEAAAIELRVEASECELTISASQSMPVAAGSRITLTAHAGSLSSEVSRYEWKPSGSGSGSSTCRIESVSAGPVRYTCTAVLKSGQRITGTLVVTGTELIASQHSVTLGENDNVQALSVAWSNGAPDGSIRYRWNVRGESNADLTGYLGTALPVKYLSDLPARTNPYTVSCQAYSGSTELGSAATMQVRIAAGGPATHSLDAAKSIAGDENGKAPDTDDADSLQNFFWLCPAAAFILLSAGRRLTRSH